MEHEAQSVELMRWIIQSENSQNQDQEEGEAPEGGGINAEE